MCFLIRSFFRLLKKDSATALSQQLPLRLILGSRRFVRQNRRHASLPNWVVDTEFCDQTIAPTTARPGGLANGSPTAAASGTTQAACAADLQGAANAFVLVNPSLEDARMVMSSNNAIARARAP